MIRSRFALLMSAAIAAAIAAFGGGWVAGAVVTGWFLAFAPGSALCRLLGVPTQRASGWITVIAASFSIDVVASETMVYAHAWTPLRGILALCALTALLVIIDARATRRRRATRRIRR